MRIDATTLSDLEIFGSESGPGLFELIDHTSTSRGRAALRARLRNPARDAASICGVQDAVRFLHDHASLRLFDGPGIDAVSRYVQSNIVIESRTDFGAHIEERWLSIRHRDLLKEIQAGLDATDALFTHALRVCESMSALEPPPTLSDLVDRLQATAITVSTICSSGSLLKRDRELRRERKREILDALDLAGELDALQSMGTATRALGFSFPEVVDDETFVLEARDVFHPFISDGVRNPVRLDGGEPLVFLTGPNMAGKTTYLRSVAIVVLLAQTGMGVPARGARVSPVEVLFTSLNPKDNLRSGLSYFFAEIMRVKEAATFLAEGRRALVIFDEVFKGTNVRDALEASAAVILGFAKARQSGFMFSSHLTELVDVLRSNPAIRFYCFDGDIQNGVAEYTYALREGVSDKRLGLVLLHQAQVPQLLARIGA